ncbi:MAG: type II toxin-antitoxin system RelE/ParE family toxin [Thiobacillus sp.]|nr:type II toxin-antitoxin system RelE/ParE family toxin [Thiobacillus sp.]
MRYAVRLTAGAERDLESIYDHISAFDSRASADHVLDGALKAADTLAAFPGRGVYPRELITLGIREYRQVFFQPYRLIYRIIERKVYIVLIADGRRDMQTLLARRLLGE